MIWKLKEVGTTKSEDVKRDTVSFVKNMTT